MSPLPFELGGLQVIINNAPSPMLAVVITSSGQSANAQINFQVPMERNALLFPTPQNQDLGFVAVQAVLDASKSEVVSIASITPFPSLPMWGGFFADADGYGFAQHASDYSRVTPQNPAHPGEAIIAYADDFFPVWPPPPVGFLTPLLPLFQILPPYLTPSVFLIGSLYLQDYPQLDFKGRSYTNTPALQVLFEGLAPGQVGVEQINFVVPANQQPGDWALFFNIGSCPDGRATPGLCGNFGSSSPFVKIPVR